MIWVSYGFPEFVQFEISVNRKIKDNLDLNVLRRFLCDNYFGGRKPIYERYQFIRSILGVKNDEKWVTLESGLKIKGGDKAMENKCPMCGNDKVGANTIYEYGHLVEYFIDCPKCKFFEHWAYGGYQSINKPTKWRYYFKFRKYVKKIKFNKF